MGVGHWIRKHPTSELADWWDKNNTPDPGQVMLDKMEHDADAQLSRDLSDFVDAHPHLWVIAVTVQRVSVISRKTQHALDVHARMNDLTNMYVDVLRFGEGAAEFHETGRIAPLIQDVLRGATIASAAAKSLQSFRPVLGHWIGLYEDINPGAPLCAPINLGNVARLTGQRPILLNLEKICKALGVDLSIISKAETSGIKIPMITKALEKLKIPFVDLGRGSSFAKLVELVKTGEKGEGVVYVSVEQEASGGGHALLIEKTPFGEVRIVDRSGYYTSKNIDKLAEKYGGKFSITRKSHAILIKNASVKMIDGVHTLMVAASLALKLAGNMTVPELNKKFQHFKATRPASAGSSEAGSINITVERGDTLSDLAQKYYGTNQYWPLLWDANRAAIGPNPNRIRPGMPLSVPPKSSFSSTQLQDAMRRFPTWRNYH